MKQGEIGNGEDMLVRVHSECLIGDIFGSARCDCGNKLGIAMKKIEEAGRGVLVYLRGQEGMGLGFAHKSHSYNLQEKQFEVAQTNGELHIPVNSREYGIGAQVLNFTHCQNLILIF